MRSFGLVLAASFLGLATAQAQTPSDAYLLQDWVCPSGSCQTRCNGPAGMLTIDARDVKVFQFVRHPRRLWLLADGVVYVLGDDDRCQFGGGTSTPIKLVDPPAPPAPPVETSPLSPPGPACVCIGNQCNPPGCAPPVRTSPLR